MCIGQERGQVSLSQQKNQAQQRPGAEGLLSLFPPWSSAPSWREDGVILKEAMLSFMDATGDFSLHSC